MKEIRSKFIDSLFSVCPISLFVLVLALVFGVDSTTVVGFLVGSLMLIAGMTLFTHGAEVSLMPIGELMGTGLTRTRNLILILVVSFITGLLVTVAEPGLIVLGGQVDAAISQWTLIVSCGIGVGLFLAISMIRTYFKLSLRMLFLVFYVGVFVLAVVLTVFDKGQLLTLAFDSSGATTGAITVPFIMAFGFGIASIKGESKPEDNFGLTALSSIGPIIAVLLLGFMANDTDNLDLTKNILDFSFDNFRTGFVTQLLTALVPLVVITVFFLVFQLLFIRVSRKRLWKIFVGVSYTLVGLLLFLLGANVTFLPMGNQLGSIVAESDHSWLLIPIGFVIGCLIVAAEPAIYVLNAKVEEISDGMIKKRQMLIALMVGIGISIALAMVRVLFDLSLWWMIAPGYLISLALMYFVPKIFTAVAFDSGGVASGPMTSAFLLPLAIGACQGMVTHGGSGSILEFAFGIIAMVSMTPLITIQLMGLIAKLKQARLVGQHRLVVDDVVIELV